MDLVLFQMWEPFRQNLIAKHIFYVQQSQKRLLSQFDNIKSEADSAVEEWLNKNINRDDISLESAGDFRDEFYGLLKNLHQQTILNVASGIYYNWEKQLRDWLIQQIKRWYRWDESVSSDKNRGTGDLGSGLIDHSQKITVAAMHIADMKV